MTSILVLGQPYSASRIARALNSRATEVRATFVPQRSYVKLLAMPPRSERVVLMRVGYRVGAATPRGRLFDAYWALLRRALPRAQACHFWLGTDVMETVEAGRAGNLRWAAINDSQGDLHLSVAPWLTAELESVGIQATTALLPPSNHAPTEAPRLPSTFAILTYLPAARFEFYGGPTILEVASRLPEARFDVVGNTGEEAGPAISNVRWLGWVTDMQRHYEKASVVVRIPRHDGFGNTVIEGLFNARHVIYTHDVPFVQRVSPPTAGSLLAAVRALQDAHVAGALSSNLPGRAWALDEFDETTLVNRLAALLRARA